MFYVGFAKIPFSAAVLPSPEFWYDRVVCSHDLERFNGGNWKRESNSGGFEVRIVRFLPCFLFCRNSRFLF